MDKKMKHKVKKEKIMKEFLKMEGYRIEVSERSFILFENEEFFMDIFYLEKVFFFLLIIYYIVKIEVKK